MVAMVTTFFLLLSRDTQDNMHFAIAIYEYHRPPWGNFLEPDFWGASIFVLSP